MTDTHRQTEYQTDRVPDRQAKHHNESTYRSTDRAAGIQRQAYRAADRHRGIEKECLTDHQTDRAPGIPSTDRELETERQAEGCFVCYAQDSRVCN